MSKFKELIKMCHQEEIYAKVEFYDFGEDE